MKALYIKTWGAAKLHLEETVWNENTTENCFLKNELRGDIITSEDTWIRQTQVKVLFDQCNLLLSSWSPSSKNIQYIFY